MTVRNWNTVIQDANTQLISEHLASAERWTLCVVGGWCLFSRAPYYEGFHAVMSWFHTCVLIAAELLCHWKPFISLLVSAQPHKPNDVGELYTTCSVSLNLPHSSSFTKATCILHLSGGDGKRNETDISERVLTGDRKWRSNYHTWLDLNTWYVGM